MAPQTFTKVDLTPRRHHGYAVLLFIFGTLFPPLGEPSSLQGDAQLISRRRYQPLLPGLASEETFG